MMLKVTVDMVPFGYESERHTIGEMHIINDGSGNATRGNYTVRLLRKGSKKVLRRARVENYARLNRPVWDLVKLSLAALDEEKGEPRGEREGDHAEGAGR